MNRNLIANVVCGETNKIQGFVENLRNKRTMAFLVIRDHTGRLQVTIEKEKHPDLAAIVDQLTVESVVTCVGPVVENEYVKMGGKEMLPEEMEILSIAEPLPLTKDAAGVFPVSLAHALCLICQLCTSVCRIRQLLVGNDTRRWTATSLAAVTRVRLALIRK